LFSIDEAVYNEHIKFDQELNMEYSRYLPTVTELFEASLKGGDTKVVLLLDNQKEEAELMFKQENEFKDIYLLAVDFKESTVDQIKDSISYRINSAHQLNKLVQERTKDISKIIQTKNEVLWAEIKKGIDLAQVNSLQGQKIDIPEFN